MRAGSFERAREAFKESPHPIDAYHMQFKQECWAERWQLEALIDLTNHVAYESKHNA